MSEGDFHINGRWVWENDVIRCYVLCEEMYVNIRDSGGIDKISSKINEELTDIFKEALEEEIRFKEFLIRAGFIEASQRMDPINIERARKAYEIYKECRQEHLRKEDEAISKA